MKETNMTDYSEFRLNRLNEPRFRHLKLLIFWPLYGLAFAFLERFRSPDTHYSVMYCALDDKIPFCEFFVIPYFFWFVFLIGMLLYTLFYDTASFRNYMIFIILSYSVTILIYLLFPNRQALRPASFARDNLLTRLVSALYVFDTDTNVFPSLHVIGSFAVLFTAWNCPRFSGIGWRLAFLTVTVLISVSTLFLKQHSVPDVAAGLLISLLLYPVAFGRKRIILREKTVL